MSEENIDEGAVSPRAAESPTRLKPLGGPLVTIVMPCLDEAESIASCVAAACRALDALAAEGEVLVVDNGSSDGSAELALAAGARVIHEPRRGYGSAYLAGFAAARGRYIVMADADGSYELEDTGRFVQALDDGADLVMGSRLRGRIDSGAMPWLHRRIGNPLLTGVLNLFFGTGVSDAHCGMRAFRRELLPRLGLTSTGMEFASEHIIRSGQLGLDIREIPIAYRRRTGHSKLASFRDGWRHLRLLFVLSPTWLFLVPGALLVACGAMAGTVVLADLEVLGRRWDMHTLIASAMLAIVGSQLLQFGAAARFYAALHLGERETARERMRRRVSLETAAIAGVGVGVAGLVVLGFVMADWAGRDFGALRAQHMAVVGMTLVVIGVQAVFGAFLMSVLTLGAQRSETASVREESSELPPQPLLTEESVGG